MYPFTLFKLYYDKTTLNYNGPSNEININSYKNTNSIFNVKKYMLDSINLSMQKIIGNKNNDLCNRSNFCNYNFNSNNLWLSILFCTIGFSVSYKLLSSKTLFLK